MSHHLDRLTSYGPEVEMCFLMPRMFDITKLGGNSTLTNWPNLQCYGACHQGYPTRDICVRICETARSYEGCAQFFAAMPAVYSAPNYRTVAHRGASMGHSDPFVV
jgi:hypothetical protein